ncbi:MAG: DUF2147 domain-containing protein [Burkholderiaceae bacterium]|nr:DUF2147 domain-containing protein [Burkholderiaceae bacterium]
MNTRLQSRIALSAFAVSFTILVALGAGTDPARAQGANSPVGLWKSVDDETKKPKSLIRIVESGGVLSGKVEKILTDKTDAKCDKCTDDRKDKPVQGMTIITGMKKEAEGWGGGDILDPNNGKVYRSQMALVEGGKKLEVRGYVGIPLFGRTQTWIREE